MLLHGFFMHMHDFSLKKINVKLAYTYWGYTKIYFLKWGCRTKMFKKPYTKSPYMKLLAVDPNSENCFISIKKDEKILGPHNGIHSNFCKIKNLLELFHNLKFLIHFDFTDFVLLIFDRPQNSSVLILKILYYYDLFIYLVNTYVYSKI